MLSMQDRQVNRRFEEASKWGVYGLASLLGVEWVFDLVEHVCGKDHGLGLRGLIGANY